MLLDFFKSVVVNFFFFGNSKQREEMKLLIRAVQLRTGLLHVCNCGRKVKNEISGEAEHKKSLGGEAINVLSLKSLFSNI